MPTSITGIHFPPSWRPYYAAAVLWRMLANACFYVNCSYVGEVGLWIGIWALCTASLNTSYVPRYIWFFSGMSPLMTYFLLRKVSGVPPLEVCRCFICQYFLRLPRCCRVGGHSRPQMTRHSVLSTAAYVTADSHSPSFLVVILILPAKPD